MAMEGYSAFPKLQHCWNITIRLFSVISRTLVVGVVLDLCREAIGVFNSPSRLGKSSWRNLEDVEVFKYLWAKFTGTSQGKNVSNSYQVYPLCVVYLFAKSTLKSHSNCQSNVKYTKPLFEPYCSWVLRRGQSTQKTCGNKKFLSLTVSVASWEYADPSASPIQTDTEQHL